MARRIVLKKLAVDPPTLNWITTITSTTELTENQELTTPHFQTCGKTKHQEQRSNFEPMGQIDYLYRTEHPQYSMRLNKTTHKIKKKNETLSDLLWETKTLKSYKYLSFGALDYKSGLNKKNHSWLKNLCQSNCWKWMGQNQTSKNLQRRLQNWRASQNK